jgi:carbon monoxide dehydrogenase subunit G
MIRLEDSITVNRPIEEAFAYVADFETVAEWDPGVRAAERQTPGVEGVGAAYRVVATFRGREIPMTYETVEHDPPHRVVLVGEGANIHARDAITFEAVDAKEPVLLRRRTHHKPTHSAAAYAGRSNTIW